MAVPIAAKKTARVWTVLTNCFGPQTNAKTATERLSRSDWILVMVALLELRETGGPPRPCIQPTRHEEVAEDQDQVQTHRLRQAHVLETKCVHGPHAVRQDEKKIQRTAPRHSRRYRRRYRRKFWRTYLR